MTFETLPPLLSEALAARGYENPTPVQAAVLDANAEGRDLIVSAQTGSGKTAFREAALFTHRGLSGPAILQISSYWRSGEEIGIDFLPDQAAGWAVAAKSARPRTHFHTLLGELLPGRLAEALAKKIGHWGELANLSDDKLRGAEQRLADWRFRPNGSEGFAKAEVTAGGIDTAGLSSQTMAARSVPGLYAIGEAVDVTGWLGGYNFQWAWASGVAAGMAL